MKSNYFGLLGLCLWGFGIGAQGLYAQKTVGPAGGNATGGGASVSYTIGQIDYVVNYGQSFSSWLGVQQPYEISEIVGLDQDRFDLDCKVYPNPATDHLIFEIEGAGLEKFSYQILALNGTLILSGEVETLRTVISVEDLALGVYLLRLTQGRATIKTFKIIKSN